MSNRLLPLIAVVLFALSATSVAAVEDAQVTEKQRQVTERKKPKFQTESVRGKVVWLGEALKTHFGISTVPESHERALAIHTADGQLLPLAEDLRGRSFRKDDRLRGKSMELFVRRYADHPIRQIIRIYEIMDGKKYEVDYWCDICAIVMFEKGPCSCCQDENRLRHRLAEAKRK